ncbi:hypothetical protein SRHO_G00305680 [Serrasalmus rhombeus]
MSVKGLICLCGWRRQCYHYQPIQPAVKWWNQETFALLHYRCDIITGRINSTSTLTSQQPSFSDPLRGDPVPTLWGPTRQGCDPETAQEQASLKCPNYLGTSPSAYAHFLGLAIRADRQTLLLVAPWHEAVETSSSVTTSSVRALFILRSHTDVCD